MQDRAREFAMNWLSDRLPVNDILSDGELDEVISEMLLVADQLGYAPSEIALALAHFVTELDGGAVQ